ncbi:hypothetical protein RF11_05819 [Thelohanellus kitauei]|uniref:Ribosome biogenesis protein NOP53 n=1 Tax=Thelohanellus kitauei TaxID=669202 RepID=A0A0C2IW82_THEKT|nr:hypothetical protein RF11_05819 [Thelohanellus kitauei]
MFVNLENIKNAPRVTENALDPEISISYNPNLIDLQSKLNDLGEKHLAELKKREKINKKVGKTLKTLNNRRKFQEEMAEFIDGKVGDESSAESEDESDDIIIKNIPNRYKKKTRPQRKKEMEKKLKVS